MPTIMVFEEDEPEVLQSSILGPDGVPIMYDFPSEKQGFIGFIPPREEQPE